MKLKKNLVLIVVFLSLSFCTSNSSAASRQMYRQTDMEKIKTIRNQISEQMPILKEKIKPGKINGKLIYPVTHTKKCVSSKLNGIREKMKKDAGNVKLYIDTSEDVNKLSDELETYGARIIKTRNNTAAVDAPIENLVKILSKVNSIESARLPLRFYPQSVESEGIAVTGSYEFHDLDYHGAGVKIAVVDVGFKGLTEAQENGDIPDDAVTYDFTGNAIETEYYHGTACAEIVYDMAPQAELYLLKVSTGIDIMSAIDYCIDNSIDIISLSIGTFGTGPGDGTGMLDEAFDDARDNGILVVAAAGNNGITSVDTGNGEISLGAHWKGYFRDNNGDNIHEFLVADTEYDFNLFAAYPATNDDGDPEDSEVSVLLRWNDWYRPDIDYDMILMEYNIDTGEVEEITRSKDLQNGSLLQEPVEYISLDIPDEEDYLHYYAVSIVKSGGDQDAETEIYLGGTSMFLPFDEQTGPIATSSSSIIEPADAESVLAVGAVNYTYWSTGPQEDYCSQGPTNAWAGSSARVKPDVMGPDGVSTFTYGDSLTGNGFYGASASTPHVSGLAALILSKYPEMTPDVLQDAVELTAVDMGSSGKDNIYGWGRINAVTDLSAAINPPESDAGSGGGGGGGGGCFISTVDYSTFR